MTKSSDLMILQDINSAIDHQQRQTEVTSGAFKKHKTNHSGCVQRLFDQSKRHLSKSPNIEKSQQQYGTDYPLKPRKSASSAGGGGNVFFWCVCVSDTFSSVAACQMSHL